MRKAACWIVRQRRWILALTLILAAVCGVLIPGVQVNSDMTKYLPEDSQMRAGMRLMEAEFPAEEDTCTVRAMFGGLSPEQREKRLEELKELPHVSSVTYAPDSPDYNQGDWALYVLTTEYGYDTPEEAELERTLREDFGASVANDDTSAPEIPLTVYAVAFGVILLILLLACDSYFEPLLFLVTIGVAVALNLGTNYFLGEISDVTAGVAAILQLALSMDYSIILMNRYRQELAVTDDRTKAMENALTASFGAIAGSGFTTIVGLMMLLFMSFQIGTDLGVVLAKGVAFSMLCVFTARPGLILMFHKVIEKTTRRRKPRPEHRRNPLQALGGFSYRRLIVAIFLLLFAGGYLLQGQTATVYTLSKVDPVAEVFPKDNRLVLLYENQDEVAAGKIVETLSAQSVVRSVVSYAGTLGRSCTVDEMESALSAMGEGMAVPSDMLRMVYYAFCTVCRLCTGLPDRSSAVRICRRRNARTACPPAAVDGRKDDYNAPYCADAGWSDKHGRNADHAVAENALRGTIHAGECAVHARFHRFSDGRRAEQSGRRGHVRRDDDGRPPANAQRDRRGGFRNRLYAGGNGTNPARRG